MKQFSTENNYRTLKKGEMSLLSEETWKIYCTTGIIKTTIKRNEREIVSNILLFQKKREFNWRKCQKLKVFTTKR